MTQTIIISSDTDTDTSIDNINTMDIEQLREYATHMWMELAYLAADLDGECPSIVKILDAIKEGGLSPTKSQLPLRFKHYKQNTLYAEVDNVEETITIFNSISNRLFVLKRIDASEMPVVEVE